MDVKDISVIIPVHNAEAYLQDCLIALLQQKNDISVEYILVNNGSTDNSKQICQEFANKYSQFKLVNLDSSGVSNARNTGLTYACGTYVMFCDSDDIPSQYWVSCLYDAITTNMVDMGVCRYKRFESISTIKEETLQHNKIMVVDDLNDRIKKVLLDPTYGGYLWNKIFKKKYIDEFEIKFNKNYSLLEDQSFVVEYLLHSNSAAYLSSTLYYYRASENGLSDAKITDNRLENESMGRSDIFEKISQELRVDSSTKRIAWQQLMRTYVASVTYFAKKRDINNIKSTILNLKKYYSKEYSIKDSGWRFKEKAIFWVMCMIKGFFY